ncbi:reverse transcriptase domain-containing protein [Tanacetum coccineum]
MEAQYEKFLNMICIVRINVPLVDVLAGMPNYGKFLKELISNKHKIEQISTAFLSDESSAMIQNKVPPKLRDPGSFLIPLAENMLIEVAKFTFPADFVILEMEEDKPPMDLELKPLPDNLEYVFLEEPSFLPVIISSQLSKEKKNKLIQLLDDKKPVVQKQRRYFQIPINPNDQEKTTFTCPFGTYAYRRMPFGLCNALAIFQRCMLAIFHDMIEESVEVFMDDFSVFENSFDKCLNNLDKMLQCCKDVHLVLNREKCHFMVKEGIVLGHMSSTGLEVDKAKIDVISKLPPLLTSIVLEAFLDMPVFTEDS